LSDRTSPRINLETPVQLRDAMTNARPTGPGRNQTERSSRSVMPGMEMMTSTRRIRMLSMAPPKNPATDPTVLPMTSATANDRTATVIEIRPP
jgi:hypothetical protein